MAGGRWSNQSPWVGAARPFDRRCPASTIQSIMGRVHPSAIESRAPTLINARRSSALALAIVASFKAVGTLLVFGLLVAPPAAATLVTRRIPTAMVVAAVFGCVSVVAGLLVSYHHDTAAAATIAACAVGLFFVVLAARSLLDTARGVHGRTASKGEA